MIKTTQEFILFGRKISFFNRVFSNFYCAFLDHVFRHESIKNKYRKINNETIDKHINAHIRDSLI